MARSRATADDFRLARQARTRYSLADLTLAADLATARTIAARVNAGRGGTPVPPAPDAAAGAEPLTAGQLHAAGLLVAILGRIVDRYRAEADPAAIAAADGWLRDRLGNKPMSTAVASFATEFPAHLTVPERPDPPTAIAQLLLLASLDENEAVDPFRELVDLHAVREGRTLGDVADALDEFFAERPGFGPEGRSLVELLRQPAAAAPGSLADQLRWIRDHWAGLFEGALSDLLDQLLVALDVLAEERMAADRAWFASHDPGAGGPAEVYHYDLGEEERFSQDRDWMPRLVLLAKSTYVWLDQLSRRYGREIRTLDAIPDDELDRLAGWGITGLWLIGLWERSAASERIKRLRGDPDAVASAYSLDDYAIAADLGGPGALADLRERAAARGIRLASDMVPNHMGIDSRWVIEHPERFLSLPDSPFPAYSFNGPDLSSDEPGRDRPRGPLLRLDRRGGRVQALRPADRRRPLRLPRQRRHELPVERHGPARLLEGRGARGGHPDDPRRRPPVPGHPLRCRHGPRQEARPAPVVPGAGPRRGDPEPGRATA